MFIGWYPARYQVYPNPLQPHQASVPRESFKSKSLADLPLPSLQFPQNIVRWQRLAVLISFELRCLLRWSADRGKGYLILACLENWCFSTESAVVIVIEFAMPRTTPCGSAEEREKVGEGCYFSLDRVG
jgi:hypothetical protein